MQTTNELYEVKEIQIQSKASLIVEASQLISHDVVHLSQKSESLAICKNLTKDYSDNVCQKSYSNTVQLQNKEQQLEMMLRSLRIYDHKQQRFTAIQSPKNRSNHSRKNSKSINKKQQPPSHITKLDKIAFQAHKNYATIVKPFQNLFQSSTITFEEFQKIQNIFTKKNTSTAELDRINQVDTITYRTFCTLKPSLWINDEVINTYISLMNQSLTDGDYKIMNTFFSVALQKNKNIQRIILKNGISKTTKLIIPIHFNRNHWFFVYINNGKIRVYNSLKNKGIPHQVIQFSFDVFDGGEVIPMEFPQQKGGDDCGVFMLCGIKQIVYQDNHKPSWKFSLDNMDYQRLIIARDILNGIVTKFKTREK